MIFRNLVGVTCDIKMFIKYFIVGKRILKYLCYLAVDYFVLNNRIPAIVKKFENTGIMNNKLFFLLNRYIFCNEMMDVRTKFGSAKDGFYEG